jgi:hypothetical protein
MFDWLKELVAPEKKVVTKKKAESQSASFIKVDSRSYPIADINMKGVVAENFDSSLVAGQAAKIAVFIQDAAGKFSFPATVTVEEVRAGNLVRLSWNMLPVEVENTLRIYFQRRKALKS